MRSVVNIAICDDEDLFIEQLYKYLSKHMNGIPCRFIPVRDGMELIRLCECDKIDVVFLDIVMPGISGFEVAEQIRRIRSEIILIFVSSMENSVYTAYEYQPFWFIPKSQMWLLEKVTKNMVKKLNDLERKNKTIQLRLGSRVEEIDTSAIEYFCTEGHYVKYITRGGSESSSFRCKLSTVEEQLDQYSFIRAHNRFLVNLRCVCSVSGSSLILHGGKQIPVSRSNMAAVKSGFQEYLRSI